MKENKKTDYEAWMDNEIAEVEKARRYQKKVKKKKLSNSALAYNAQRSKARKNKRQVNCFVEIVTELMNERGLRDADVVKSTGLAWTSWYDKISGNVKTQMVDENLFKIMKFFNCSLQYLCYGIGEPDPIFDEDSHQVQKMALDTTHD